MIAAHAAQLGKRSILVLNQEDATERPPESDDYLEPAVAAIGQPIPVWMEASVAVVDAVDRLDQGREADAADDVLLRVAGLDNEKLGVVGKVLIG